MFNTVVSLPTFVDTRYLFWCKLFPHFAKVRARLGSRESGVGASPRRGGGAQPSLRRRNRRCGGRGDQPRRGPAPAPQPHPPRRRRRKARGRQPDQPDQPELPLLARQSGYAVVPLRAGLPARHAARHASLRAARAGRLASPSRCARAARPSRCLARLLRWAAARAAARSGDAAAARCAATRQVGRSARAPAVH